MNTPLKIMAVCAAIFYGVSTIALATVYLRQTPEKPILDIGLLPLHAVGFGLFMFLTTSGLACCLFRASGNRKVALFAALQLISGILAATIDSDGKGIVAVSIFATLSFAFTWLAVDASRVKKNPNIQR